MNHEEAKAKVAKLLSLAKNSAATENEAERAMTQAEFLMRKFGIEAAECIAAGTAPGFDWGSQFTPYGNKYHQARSLPMWYQFVATGIAVFTDTIVRTHTKAGQGCSVGFYGEKSDIAFAVWLMDYLRDSVQSAAAEQTQFSRSDREAFRKGMATRLACRMRNLRKERDIAYAAAKTATGTALVIIQDKLAKRDAEFGAPNYQASKVAVTNASAADLGRSAADKVNLNRAVSTTQTQVMLAA